MTALWKGDGGNRCVIADVTSALHPVKKKTVRRRLNHIRSNLLPPPPVPSSWGHVHWSSFLATVAHHRGHRTCAVHCRRRPNQLPTLPESSAFLVRANIGARLRSIWKTNEWKTQCTAASPREHPMSWVVPNSPDAVRPLHRGKFVSPPSPSDPPLRLSRRLSRPVPVRLFRNSTALNTYSVWYMEDNRAATDPWLPISLPLEPSTSVWPQDTESVVRSGPALASASSLLTHHEKLSILICRSVKQGDFRQSWT